MARIVGKIGWRITTIVVGIPVGIAAKKGVERAWLTLRPENPPTKPRDPNVDWRDALIWAALSGIGVALAQLATTKGAATLWRNLIGAEPPVKTENPEAKQVTPA